MCDPVTAMMTLQMGKQVIGDIGKRKTADAQMAGYDTQRRAQAEELGASRDQKMGDRIKQSRKERSRLLVAAGESGVSGQSFEATLMNNIGQANQDNAVINKQAGFEDRASAARHKSAYATVDRPSGLQMAFNAANAGAQGYTQGKQLEALQIPKG